MQEIKLYIKEINNELQIFVTDNGQIVEQYVENVDKKRIEENIYLGKVTDILKGMHACFVDIGEEKNALLYIKDLIPKQSDVTGNDKIDLAKYKISDYVKTNDRIVVQVKKDSSYAKGAKVTKDIKLTGRYTILMPYSKFVTFSKKIVDTKIKDKLKTIGEELVKKYGYGIIFRTSSELVDEENIKNDFKKLAELWKNINDIAKDNEAPVRLYDNKGMLGKLLKDFSYDKFEVYTNSKDVKKIITSIDDNINVKICDVDFDLDYSRKIWLKCGGFITIDPTEALIAVDVNSGKYTGKKELKDTILKVNIEAAKEIAKQIKLRDLGGMIIIDFIDMDNEEDRKKVKEAFELESKGDRSKVQVLEFTELGLLEVTRKHIFGK